MSRGEAVERAYAAGIAERFTAALEPVTERIAIAGSLRRGRPSVHDIEVVAVPRFRTLPADDIWGTPTEVDLLEERLTEMLSRKAITPRPVENHRRDGTVDVQYKLGPAFKALVVGGIATDLFVVRAPASWGVIYALRTGPGDWNTKLVTDCQSIGRRVAGGQVEAWSGDRWEPVPTPEEPDFFRALGQAWVDPGDRRPDRVRIQRAIASTGTGSEYGRLLAERDRLVAQGADPDELTGPERPG